MLSNREVNVILFGENTHTFCVSCRYESKCNSFNSIGTQTCYEFKAQQDTCWDVECLKYGDPFVCDMMLCLLLDGCPPFRYPKEVNGFI